MIEGQNHNSKIGRYWQPIILTRWLIVNLIMVLLKDSYVAQIFSLMFISVLFQTFIILGQPMPKPSENKFALIVETSVSIYLYIMLGLTDYMGENLVRDNLGWFLAIIVVSVVLVNVLTLLYQILKNLYRRYLKLRKYFRLKYQHRSTIMVKPSTHSSTFKNAEPKKKSVLKVRPREKSPKEVLKGKLEPYQEPKQFEREVWDDEVHRDFSGMDVTRGAMLHGRADELNF